jgi:hypothetical protein
MVDFTDEEMSIMEDLEGRGLVYGIEVTTSDGEAFYDSYEATSLGKLALECWDYLDRDGGK